MSIADNLALIRARIEAACLRARRDPSSVRLVAVSKQKPVRMIQEALEAGQTVFGENYVQDIKDKVPQIETPVQWHFIGHLQSNKIKYLRGKVAMIESVDRLSLAEELNLHWGKLNQTLQVLVQVNIGGEESKSGVAPEDLEELLRTMAKMRYLQVRGLMTIPPPGETPEDSRKWFRQLRELSESMIIKEIPGIELTELSMGMSDDFEVAIEEGATLVRVGSAIFGNR